MDLRQLRQFVVLSEELSFRKAAVRLHMSQPPLSISIRQLENELGVQLFERDKTGVRLSDAGRCLLDDTRRALYYADQVRESAALIAQGRAGSLSIHFVSSATIRVLPRAIARFRETCPKVELHLGESTADVIMRALRDHTVDLGIIRYPCLVPAALETMVIDRDRLVAALPMAHELGERTGLQLADLKDEPFVFFSNLEGSTSHAFALAACAQAGFAPRIVQEVAHAQTLISLVESGLGVALVPDSYEHIARGRVQLKELADVTGLATGLAAIFRKHDRDRAIVGSFLAALAPADLASAAAAACGLTGP